MGQINSTSQFSNNRLIDNDTVQLFDSEITINSDDAILDYNVNCLMNSSGNDNFENRSFRKLSKLRKSLSECFKVKHKRFGDESIEDDCYSDNYSRMANTPNNSSNNSTPMATNNNTPIHKPRPQSVASIPCSQENGPSESVLVVDTRVAQQPQQQHSALVLDHNHFCDVAASSRTMTPCQTCLWHDQARHEISDDVRDLYSKLIQLQDLLSKPNERKRTMKSSESDTNAPYHLPSTLDPNSLTTVSSPQLELSRQQHLLEELKRENAQLRAALATTTTSTNKTESESADHIKDGHCEEGLVTFLAGLQPGHIISHQDQQFIQRMNQTFATHNSSNRRTTANAPPHSQSQIHTLLPQTIAVVNPHRVEKTSTKTDLKASSDQQNGSTLTNANAQDVGNS